MASEEKDSTETYELPGTAYFRDGSSTIAIEAVVSEPGRALLARAAQDVRRVAAMEGRESDRLFGLAYRSITSLIDNAGPAFALELAAKMIAEEKSHE